jgi:hypothetical protein
MDCREFLDNYSDYLDRRLESRPLSEYRDHLRNCPSCGRYDRTVQKGLRVVRDLTPPAPAPDFKPRLQHRIFHVQDEISRSSGWRAGLTTGIAAALAGVLLMSSFSALKGRQDVLQLPPVVVEAPARITNGFSAPGVFPRGFTVPSLMVTPEFGADTWLVTPPSHISLFRAPLDGAARRDGEVAPNSED